MGTLTEQIGSTPFDATAYEGLAPTEKIGEDSLRVLNSMAQELAQRERELADAKAAVQRATANLFDIQERRLPAFMQQFNCLRHDFVDAVTGEKRTIVFDSDWSVRMPTIKVGNVNRVDQEKARGIYAWLRVIQEGGSIKKTYEIEAGLLPDDTVAAIDALVHEHWPTLDTGISEKIEPMTLAKIIKRRLATGAEVHQDLRVEPVKRAVFKDK